MLYLFRTSSGRLQYFLDLKPKCWDFNLARLDSAATRRENISRQQEPSAGSVVRCNRISDRGAVTMNKDNFEGTIRSAVGQGEKVLGQATNDRATTAQGCYDDAAGKARSAFGSARDGATGSVDAVSALDFSGLRNEISKLTQKVSDLAQNQVSAGRDQVVGAMGVAGESLSQS